MATTRHVKYPERRADLRMAAWCLSDDDYQSRIWAMADVPTPVDRFDFDHAILYVADYLGGAGAAGLMGYVLADEAELADFADLNRDLMQLLELIGPMGTFADASQSPEWAAVRASARTLYERLSD